MGEIGGVEIMFGGIWVVVKLVLYEIFFSVVIIWWVVEKWLFGLEVNILFSIFFRFLLILILIC